MKDSHPVLPQAWDLLWGRHSAVKASTSEFYFISSSPLLQDTFLHSLQPRLIFMQRLRLAGTVPKAC